MTAETGELAAGPAAALAHGRRARPRSMETARRSNDLRDLPAHVIEQAVGTSICAGIHADDGISCCLCGWPRGRSFFQLRSAGGTGLEGKHRAAHL